MRTHQEIDQRSLALHRLVAERIMRDPALFEKSRLTLARCAGRCALLRSHILRSGSAWWMREPRLVLP